MGWELVACVRSESKSPRKKTKETEAPRAVALQVWSLARQLQHHLGTRAQCTLGPHSRPADSGSGLGTGGLGHGRVLPGFCFPFAHFPLSLKLSLGPDALKALCPVSGTTPFVPLSPPLCLFQSSVFPWFL